MEGEPSTFQATRVSAPFGQALPLGLPIFLRGFSLAGHIIGWMGQRVLVGDTSDARHALARLREARVNQASSKEAQQPAEEAAIATAEAALEQMAAKAREPRPKPVELPPDSVFNGSLLRQVRESRGLSLEQLAERTRISVKHLENIEADRYSALPATLYLRGMLMSVARELGQDPLRVSRSYLAQASAAEKK